MSARDAALAHLYWVARYGHDPYPDREHYERDLRAALEAAATEQRAQAQDDAADALAESPCDADAAKGMAMAQQLLRDWATMDRQTAAPGTKQRS